MIGHFGDYDGLRAFYHIIRHNHVASNRQAVHEVGIVGNGHLALAYCPGAVFAQYLSVVVAFIGRPVLGIDKIGPFKKLSSGHILRGRLSYELGVEFAQPSGCVITKS